MEAVEENGESGVTVRYFAVVRERVGRESETVSMEELSGERPTVDRLWAILVDRHPALEGLRGHLRIARNREFVDGEVGLEPGDEIAVIPPVSGGAGGEEAGERGTRAVRKSGRFVVTDRPLDRDEVRSFVERSEAGAIVRFEGVVRDHTGDRDVAHLEYECYVEMAVDKLVETGREARGKWPEVDVAMHHRHGRLEIGETAVVVAVSSPHRAEAFEACRWCIAELKREVPIWKKEVGPEGESWVGWGP